jgi:hypothetical protein
MAVVAYREADFQGLVARLGPGLHAGRGIVGCPNRSSNCEEDMPVGSLRVEPNTVACVSASRSLVGAGTGGGGGARVLVGPAEVPALAGLGLPRAGAVLVVPFRPYDGADPPFGRAVAVFSAFGRAGIPTFLGRGDFSAARLASEEVRAREVASLEVAAGAIALLFAGPDFEAGQDALAVVGPAVVDDVERLGLPAVRSLRVLLGTLGGPPPGGGLGGGALPGSALPGAGLGSGAPIGEAGGLPWGGGARGGPGATGALAALERRARGAAEEAAAAGAAAAAAAAAAARAEGAARAAEEAARGGAAGAAAGRPGAKSRGWPSPAAALLALLALLLAALLLKALGRGPPPGTGSAGAGATLGATLGGGGAPPSR